MDNPPNIDAGRIDDKFSSSPDKIEKKKPPVPLIVAMVLLSTLRGDQPSNTTHGVGINENGIYLQGQQVTEKGPPTNEVVVTTIKTRLENLFNPNATPEVSELLSPLEYPPEPLTPDTQNTDNK